MILRRQNIQMQFCIAATAAGLLGGGRLNTHAFLFRHSTYTANHLQFTSCLPVVSRPKSQCSLPADDSFAVDASSLSLLSSSSTIRLQSKRFSSSTKIHGKEEQNNLAIDFLQSQKRARTWKRLRHLVDLAVPANNYSNGKYIDNHLQRQSIADVGTDHGLLALALALSGNFHSVIGVDLSEQALQDGAFALMDQFKEKNSALPLEFRCSDGLDNLLPGEADIVCVAGMGPHNMRSILLRQKTACSDDGSGVTSFELDRIRCDKLVLQPINPRPRLLIMLYDALQDAGWDLLDERIEKLSNRWYITSSFVRKTDGNDSFALPGSKLSSSSDLNGTQKQVWEDYVHHHIRWIKQDATAGSKSICDADRRWMAEFDTY